VNKAPRPTFTDIIRIRAKDYISKHPSPEYILREHFNVLGIKQIPFKVENTWFKGECTLSGYELEELLGTKLRALYQRKKGRDLFDLYWALANHDLDVKKIIRCYSAYMNFSVNQPPTRREVLLNMEAKMNDKEFANDIHVILRPGIEYNNDKAYELIKKELIEQI
jgi:predicted nucleotidyltransferase component of viral defense system